MLRRPRRVFVPRRCATLLALIALLGMSRPAPYGTEPGVRGAAPAVHTVIGSERQPVAVVERTTNAAPAVAAELSAAGLPTILGVALATWSVLVIGGVVSGSRGRRVVVHRLRGPPVLTGS
jgi:hypothetical protein